MQIKIWDEVFECPNEMAAIETVFEQINQLLADSTQRLSCLEVDGVEVFEDYSQYIVSNLSDIQTIVVKVKTLKELMDDTLISIHGYLERAIPEIEKIVDDFYHGVSQDTWNRFAQFMEGLQFIIDALESVSQHQEWYYNAAQFVLVKDNLLKQIIILQEALESQDRVRLSDALLYEIIPSFKALMQEIYLNIEYSRVQ